MIVYLVQNKFRNHWKALFLLAITLTFLILSYVFRSPEWINSFFLVMLFYPLLSFLWFNFFYNVGKTAKTHQSFLFFLLIVLKPLLYLTPFLIIWVLQFQLEIEDVVSWKPGIICLAGYILFLIAQF